MREYTTKLLLTVAICSVSVSVAHSQVQVFDHVTGSRGTRMWVPPETSNVKGILIYGNGAGGDSRNEVLTPWYRNFAELHDFALIATSRWGNLSGAEIDLWEDHLAALANESGHPELVHAPWAPIGLSNGGQMSYGFNTLRPEKTIAFIANKGCCYNNRLPNELALKTPGILIAGQRDSQFRRDSIQGLFDDNRPRGALWSWIEQERTSHSGRADELVLPFMAEAIQARYPADQVPTATNGVELVEIEESEGWLADQSTWRSGLTQVASYQDYTGNKSEAGWLLNEGMATVYRAFSTYSRDADLSFVSEPSAEMWFQQHAPADIGLEIDTGAIDDWTSIQLFNYDELLLEITPTSPAQSTVLTELTLPSTGIYGLTALVTHADGVTLSTTDVRGLAVVPEPAVTLLWMPAVAILLYRRNRRFLRF